jgi:uncharacterized membrane protein (DUF4010 family)
MNLLEAPIAGVVVAILGGAAVGVERQRSGHASGPDARLGGIRTFTLLGTVAGVAGFLFISSLAIPGGLLVAGALAIILLGYARASQNDIDATTEVAAVVVVGAGVLGGVGQLQLSAALTTLTVLVLAEKPSLHGFAARLDEPTMLAAARFAVMSVVILPLLPEGPFGPGPGVRPRELWMLVLLFSGLSFVGYLAQRITGAAGYPLMGLLGGLVSSTSVTLSFARLSVSRSPAAAALATGAIAASAVLFLRVALAVAVLNRAMLPTLAWYLALPFLAALVSLGLSWRSINGAKGTQTTIRNPLQLSDAMAMAVLFQVVLFAAFYVQAWVGAAGVMVGGSILGLTDVDALTLAMAGSPGSIPLVLACRAIAIGIVANSLMKAIIAMTLGERRFKWQAGASLLSMAAAGAIALTAL